MPKEKKLSETAMRVERKRLQIALCENASGRFLRIAELNRERRAVVCVPESGVADFIAKLSETLAKS